MRKKLLKNWRPITLLNYDYKIITKVLTSRLRDILPNSIHPNHKCGIKGRSIHDGAALIRDLIDYVNYKNIPGLIISLDQTKAYDRVEWNFLFNFGPTFIHMIKTCYTNIESCVKVNGYTSIYFNLSRGIRQGCPISTVVHCVFKPVVHHHCKRNVVHCFGPFPHKKVVGFYCFGFLKYINTSMLSYFCCLVCVCVCVCVFFSLDPCASGDI